MTLTFPVALLKEVPPFARAPSFKDFSSPLLYQIRKFRTPASLEKVEAKHVTRIREIKELCRKMHPKPDHYNSLFSTAIGKTWKGEVILDFSNMIDYQKVFHGIKREDDLV